MGETEGGLGEDADDGPPKCFGDCVWSIVTTVCEVLLFTTFIIMQYWILDVLLIEDPFTGLGLWVIVDGLIVIFFWITILSIHGFGETNWRNDAGMKVDKDKSAHLFLEAGSGDGSGENGKDQGSGDGHSTGIPLNTMNGTQNDDAAVPVPSQRFSGWIYTIRAQNWRTTIPEFIPWTVHVLNLLGKIVYLFRHDIPQTLTKEQFVGPHMLNFGIGLTAILFTIFVYFYKHTGVNKDFINNLCFSVAVQMLDVVTLLSLLMPQVSHLILPFGLDDAILTLSSLSLLLPIIMLMKLWKLRNPDPGQILSPLTLGDIIYKFLHIVLIDIPFLTIRLYLWSAFASDPSIFIIKNIYCIIGYIREFRSDVKAYKNYLNSRHHYQD